MDFDILDDPRYMVVEADIEGVPAKVYLISPTANIRVITKGGKHLWVVPPEGIHTGTGRWIQRYDTKCFCCVSLLRNNEPNMVLVKAGDLYRTYTEVFKRGNGWSKQYIGLEKKFNELRVNSSKPLKFLLDISSTKDDAYEYKFTSYELSNAETHFYATNSGYTIGKVVEGDAILWTAHEGQICFLCEIYSKGFSKFLRLYANVDKYKIDISCTQN